MNEDRSHVPFQLLGQSLTLDSAKAMFWYEKEMLIVSDLHLGKAGHFRKSGIPIPSKIHNDDLSNLSALISKYSPKTLVFLGDLFHSDHNEEWNDFITWLESYNEIKMVLVKGNHDIMSSEFYNLANFEIVDDWTIEPFHLTHIQIDSDYYNISGHVHPAIRLHGQARQGITLPCFYFAEQFAILPAFGNFTGGYKIQPAKSSKIFAVADRQIIDLIG